MGKCWEGVKKCFGMWGKVRGGVRKCVGVWGRCGEVCWDVMWESVGKVWESVLDVEEMWGCENVLEEV